MWRYCFRGSKMLCFYAAKLGLFGKCDNSSFQVLECDRSLHSDSFGYGLSQAITCHLACITNRDPYHLLLKCY
jgi:hypothetical protein